MLILDRYRGRDANEESKERGNNVEGYTLHARIIQKSPAHENGAISYLAFI
jgi:hypothetical protein